MARKPTGNPTGRPRKELSIDQFEKLCAMLCTQQEICGFFGVTDKTLTGWVKREYGEPYSEVYKKLSADGIITTRRNLMRLSERNASAAIFLAKNLLGYSDDGTRRADEKASELLESIRDILHEEEEDEMEPETEGPDQISI